MYSFDKRNTISTSRVRKKLILPPRRPCGDSGGGTNNAAGGSSNCSPQSCRRRSLTPEVRPETMMAGGKDHFAAGLLSSIPVSSSPPRLVVTCGGGIASVGSYSGDGVGVAPRGGGPGGWQSGPSW